MKVCGPPKSYGRKKNVKQYTSKRHIYYVYEPRHGKMCLRGKFGHFEIL